ncbi:hypothetical protein PAZ_c02130 [Cutibacterium acnes 266]|nr:hypothetical protein PAZ_c02130 [Cutibacterium acnes 266]
MVVGLQPRTRRTQMVAPHRPQNVATLAVNQTSSSERKLRKPREKQDPPENRNRARQLRREYPVRSAITGGRTRTLLTCGIEADTTQRFITGNYHRPHRGEHRPGCAPILDWVSR